VFVDKEEVVHLVLCAAKFFEHTDVFAGAPDGVNGDFEASGLVEEDREFGEDWFCVFSNCGFKGFVGG